MKTDEQTGQTVISGMGEFTWKLLLIVLNENLKLNVTKVVPKLITKRQSRRLSI